MATQDSLRTGTAPLQKYGLSRLQPGHGPQNHHWDNATSTNGQHRIRAAWTRETHAQQSIRFRIQDGHGTDLASIKIPGEDCVWDVVVVRGNGLVHLQKRHANGRPLATYTMWFDTRPASRTLVLNMMNAIQFVVSRLPVDQVPYFNLDEHRRTVLPPSRSDLSILHHNLRQLPAPPARPGFRPWRIVFEANNSAITFTNYIALDVFRNSLFRQTHGRLSGPGVVDASTSDSNHSGIVVRELPPAPVSTSTNTTRRSSVMSTPTTCGGCGQDESPLGVGSIKKRLQRNQWVGCDQAEKCLSKNYWFHFGCCDAEYERLRDGRQMWLCSLCRVDTELRLIGGKYVRRTAR